MTGFKVGDILIGNENNQYATFNKQYKCKVTKVWSSGTSDISVEMIEGPNQGHSEALESKYFRLASKRPKYPTHVVVWEVNGCGDPHTVCYSKEEATEKASELLRRTDTVIDSVRIYEIKKILKPSLSLRVNVVRS